MFQPRGRLKPKPAVAQFLRLEESAPLG